MVCIANFLTPNFNEFFYVYQTTVLGIDQLQISQLLLVSLSTGVIFLVGYFLICKKLPYRCAILVAQFCNIIGQFTTLILVKDII